MFKGNYNYYKLKEDITHNPYVGTYFRSNYNKSFVESFSHNPYVGNFRHSPSLKSDISKLGLKAILISKFHNMEILTQNEVAKENRNIKELDLATLPIILFSSLTKCHIYNETTCLICLEEYKMGDELRVLPNCSHSFHRNCIDIWFTTSDSNCLTKTDFCPKCRKNASAIEEDNILIDSYVKIGRALLDDYSEEICEFNNDNGLKDSDSFCDSDYCDCDIPL